MHRSDPLFELIKSLTKSEKRYFKLFASMQGKDKKYLSLFDAIDRQDQYDEDELKQRFQTEKFVRQFSVAKNYLRTLIMKSLRMYHSGGTTRQRLYEMMLDINILVERGLKSEARKLIVKAEKLAHHFDKYPIELDAVVRRHGLDLRSTTTREGLQQMAVEQHAALDRLSNFVEYGILFYQVARLVSWGNEVRSQDDLHELKEIISHPLLRSPECTLSPRAAMRFHWIHAAVHYAFGEWQESMDQSRQIIGLIEAEPDLLPDHISFYLATVSNLLLVCEKLGDWNEFDQVLQKLHTRARTSVMKLKRRSREEATIFVLIYTHLLSMYANQGNYEAGITLIPEIEQGLPTYHDAIEPSHMMGLNVHLAAYSIVTGNYSRGVDYLNPILNRPDTFEGQGITRSARLLSLVLHYELGNTTLLKHLLPSTQHYFESRNACHKTETSLLALLSTANGSPTDRKRLDEVRNAFIQFRNQLSTFCDDPLEQGPLQFFNYDDWAAGKIEDRTMIEVARSRRVRQQKNR